VPIQSMDDAVFRFAYASLANMADLPPSHPLLERLYEWRSFADQERFAELFDAMLHQSGLVNRQLFLFSSGRELTNYLHIFEILLEQAGARRLALGEVIELLSDYISSRAIPAAMTAMCCGSRASATPCKL